VLCNIYKNIISMLLWPARAFYLAEDSLTVCRNVPGFSFNESENNMAKKRKSLAIKGGKNGKTYYFLNYISKSVWTYFLRVVLEYILLIKENSLATRKKNIKKMQKTVLLRK